MSEKHSPLPWKIEKLVGKSDDDLSFVIASAKGGHVTDFLSKADAELIETAVNSHAALVEENRRLRGACETAKAKCEQYWNEHNIGDAEIHAALEFIQRSVSSTLATPVQP